MRSNVSELLNKINRLAQLPGFPAVSQLEKDLLKQYLRELYEALDAKELVAGHDANVVEQPVTETVVNPVSKEPEPVLTEVTTTVVEETVQPLVAEAVKKENAEEKVVATVAEVALNNAVKPSVTLNELIKTGGKEIHRRFAAKPLKDMIDLNRRFVFVNELFAGDADSFAHSIKHLDSLADYREAFDFTVQSLAVKYKWDDKAQPVRLFYKLLKQRFEEE